MYKNKYAYMVKVEYSENNAEFIGSNNIFYAHWLYDTETRCGHKCTYYELIDNKYEVRSL